MSEMGPLRALTERWVGARAAERANAQTYLIELSEALGVERPRPSGSGYEFEYPVKVIGRDGSEAQNFVDLYKEGHFLLEAKDADDGRAGDLLLRRAFGQARTYAAHVPGGAPPYVLVLDVGKTLLVWDRWSGTFGGFAGHRRRIDLRTLHARPDDIALLIDIWSNPTARDPRSHAQAVTTEIAKKLAELAAALENRGLEQERVARFLMRCVFAMFAEDVGLLPREAFRQTLQNAGAKPDILQQALAGLWRAMDEGGLYGYEKLLRFNGHFFRDAEALPLAPTDISLLLEAARADWKDVEPSIFGTLLVRALDPVERHRLGAEYTPRAFIERLVRPTVEEPIRERWTAVQAEVLQLRESGRPKDRLAAETRLREFHDWMRQLRFLDPACGSGNFLYVTMHLVKEIEREVVAELEAVTGAHELRLHEVGPSQFCGIEVKPWAREIAELVLWIGFHQHWKRHHAVQPPEPVLQDTGTLECRDAVLAWDAIIHRPERDRPDPIPRIVHPVTEELVPDPEARLPYLQHLGARPAEWPEAEFIVGNPPFMGQFRQRESMGDGYVDALRAAYPSVPDAADYVMYFWYKAASAVAAGRTLRAGLITTQSIKQQQNRKVVEEAALQGARVTWAIADHYWNDGSDDARVRVTMSVIAKDPPSATLVAVDGDANVLATTRVSRLNADLTAHADVPAAAAIRLRANEGICSNGYKPHGTGFLVTHEEAQQLIAADPRNRDVLRRYRNGMDLTTRPRNVWIIDFGFASESEARQYPLLLDLVRDRVKPERDANARAVYRTFWWRFGEARRDWRAAVAGLPRYIATVKTAKHRFFTFLDADVAPDDKLTCVGSDDAFLLGVLSSSVHVTWALAAGSRLGIDGTPSYDKRTCFDAFPFPLGDASQRLAIRRVAEQIDQHRKAALSRDPVVGVTVMYNVVEKLRAGQLMTKKEEKVHRLSACGVLLDLHDELDRLVADAYGWSWPERPSVVLERLVALHDQRIDEERSDHVRWLRPEFQKPLFETESTTSTDLDLELHTPAAFVPPAPSSLAAWPPDAVGQITAVRHATVDAAVSVNDIVERFAGAKPAIVERHLETLAILGEVQRLGNGRYAGVELAV